MDREAMLERIKARMKELGFTPRLLSRTIGAGPTYIRDLFEGRSQNPSGVRLMRLAKALSMTLEELVGGPVPKGFAEAQKAAAVLEITASEPSTVIDDDHALADVAEAVDIMLREEGAARDPRSLTRMTLAVWRDIQALPATMEFADRLAVTLSERRSAVRQAQLAMFAPRSGIARR